MKKIFQGIQVVRSPKHRLSTFGQSKIVYSLVTEVPGLSDRSRLRSGHVTAETPQIITPQSLKEKFFGFGPEADEYFEMLTSQYGDALKGLQYQFHNEPLSSNIELTSPERLALELAKDFDQSADYSQVILRGTEKHWELSVMKFIVEETMASFSTNIQELEDRGFFDRRGHETQRRHREIRHLLERAKTDTALIPELGKKLKEYNLFDQYQDRFFQLMKP